MASIEQANGNAEVVMLLEKFMAEAKHGEFGHLAVAMSRKEGEDLAAFGGSQDLLEQTRANLLKIVESVDAKIENITMPPGDPSLGADYVCYSLPVAPIGFDFIFWLIEQEIVRRRLGAPAPLKVAFFKGRDGKTGLSSNSRERMFENVIRPALALIGAVEDDRALDGGGRNFTSLRKVTEAALAGEQVPTLKAICDAPDGMAGVVTITLREAIGYWPHRNSNLEAWLRVADFLAARGEKVVFIRDTDRANDALPGGYRTYPLASTDLHVRMALYEAAKANLFVSNGPAVLPVFSSKPWLTFIEPKPDGHAYHPNTPAFWRDHVGFEIGGQYPWSGPQQRIIWAADDYKNIVNAWQSVMERKETIAA